MDKEYTQLDDPDDVFPVREKAKRHLKTWTKKQLVDHLSVAAKDGWIELWADKYDDGIQKPTAPSRPVSPTPAPARRLMNLMLPS